MATITFPTDDEIKAAYVPYVQAVGEVSHAWNYLIESLGQVFAQVVAADRRIALAIWYSTDSDRSQIKMLKAAISASPTTRWLPRLPRAHEDLTWLVDKASSLAEDRNNAIHAPCSIYTSETGTEMGASFFNGNPRAKKLQGKKLLLEFAYCTHFAQRLTNFARSAETALAFEQYPWPERPALPVRGQKQPGKDQK